MKYDSGGSSNFSLSDQSDAWVNTSFTYNLLKFIEHEEKNMVALIFIAPFYIM